MGRGNMRLTERLIQVAQVGGRAGHESGKAPLLRAAAQEIERLRCVLREIGYSDADAGVARRALTAESETKIK